MILTILASLVLGGAFSSFYYIYNFESNNRKLLITKTVIMTLIIAAFFSFITLI